MKTGLLVAVSALLALVSLGSFWAIRNAGYVWDDLLFFQEGHRLPDALSLHSLRYAFTTYYTGNWHPLTLLSHSLSFQILGPNPGAHHLVNLGIHVLATIVLLLVFVRFTGNLWAAAFAAALFAVHPLHVESVAWISERKDVLSAFFWFLAMGAYGRYARRPSVTRYLAVVAALALGLMSKATAVTLPVVFLLLDVWPLARWVPEPGGGGGRSKAQPIAYLVLEKVPLLLLSAAAGLITIKAQQAWEATAAISLPLWVRAENAIVSIARYLSKTVWPTSLSYFYPHPGPLPSLWPLLGAIALLAALSALAIAAWRRFPFLLIGWLWFLVTIFPMSGMVQAGQQAMADRYTYLPLVGIFMAISWGVAGAFAGRRTWQLTAIVAGVLTIALLSLLTALQVAVWRDEGSLFRHALKVDPENWQAHLSLGRSLRTSGALDKAIVHFREAVRANPRSSNALLLLGATLGDQGKYDDARLTCERAAEIGPAQAGACFYALGNALVTRKRLSEAVEAFRRSVQLSPGDPDAWNNLGCALFDIGRRGESATALRRALALKAGHASARSNLDKVLGSTSTETTSSAPRR